MRKIFLVLLSMFCLHGVCAASDTIHLEFDHFTQGPKYYSSGDWYVVLENEEDWEVYLNWKAPKDNYCGTFRTNKFLDDYSYIFTPENRANGGIHFKDIVMTIAVEEFNPLLQQIELNATITGTDGKIYKVHATHEVINAKDEVDVSILDGTMAIEDDAYTISGKNSDWDIALTVNSATIIGSYTALDYFDLTTSRFVHQGQTITPLQLEAQVGVGYLTDSVLAYMAQCTMLGNDTVIYHMLLAVPFSAPIDTVNVKCANMRVDDTFAEVYNMMTIAASNDAYELQIMYKDNALRDHKLGLQTHTHSPTICPTRISRSEIGLLEMGIAWLIRRIIKSINTHTQTENRMQQPICCHMRRTYQETLLITVIHLTATTRGCHRDMPTVGTKIGGRLRGRQRQVAHTLPMRRTIT